MIKPTEGKIFLADERGISETKQFRSQFTFNSGNYFNPFKYPFGKIYALNDHMLAGGASQVIEAKEGFHIVLLPVSGAISYKDSFVPDTLIAAGQAQIISVNKNSSISISNPFKEDTVNYLQILIKAELVPLQRVVYLSTYDNVNKNRNDLVPLFTGISENSILPYFISIGKFSGRGETVYSIKNKNAGIFVFILEGAFEINGRLLHARDGLALWNTDIIELEALSNDAIILLIETTIDIS